MNSDDGTIIALFIQSKIKPIIKMCMNNLLGPGLPSLTTYTSVLCLPPMTGRHISTNRREEPGIYLFERFSLLFMQPRYL